MSLTPTEFRSHLEYWLVDPLAVPQDVVKQAERAADLGISAVCVAPHLLAALPDTDLNVATVCAFPHGTQHPLIKATEARFAVQNGATRINVVPNLGAVRAGDANTLLMELVTIREAITDQVELAVVLEVPAFTAEQTVQAARTAAQAGADYLVTATGYHPAGGARAQDVELLKQATTLPIIATGGIVGRAQAGELIDAGAAIIATAQPQALLG